jgi:hypothetical protein
MATLNIDSSKFPERANLTQWAKVLRLSYGTMLKYRRLKRLRGTKTLSGDLVITKATVMKCFGLEE